MPRTIPHCQKTRPLHYKMQLASLYQRRNYQRRSYPIVSTKGASRMQERRANMFCKSAAQHHSVSLPSLLPSLQARLNRTPLAACSDLPHKSAATSPKARARPQPLAKARRHLFRWSCREILACRQLLSEDSKDSVRVHRHSQ